MFCILSYYISISDKFALYLSKKAKVLYLEPEGEELTPGYYENPKLYILEDENEKDEEREFRLVAENAVFDGGDNLRFIGSFKQHSTQMKYYLFEVIPE